jgi:hypothetical protein
MGRAAQVRKFVGPGAHPELFRAGGGGGGADPEAVQYIICVISKLCYRNHVSTT